MEKVQTLLMILLGLGVFVWRMVQKVRETAAREVRERPTAPPGSNTSFQELLKQMQAQNHTATKPAGVPATRARPMPSAAPRPAQAVAPTSPRGSFSAPRPVEPSRETGPERPIADRLRTPADLRAAFVLGEILKRKFE